MTTMNIEKIMAEEFVSDDKLINFRSEKRWSDKNRDLATKAIKRKRSIRRMNSHNGFDVPEKYEVKPRKNKHDRATIRRPAFLEKQIEEEALGIVYDI